MPSAHRRYAAWSPERFQRWARTIDRTPACSPTVRPSRASLPASPGCAWFALAPARAEVIAARALAIGALTENSVASILITSQLPIALIS
jgi:hypothetical protein